MDLSEWRKVQMWRWEDAFAHFTSWQVGSGEEEHQRCCSQNHKLSSHAPLVHTLCLQYYNSAN